MEKGLRRLEGSSYRLLEGRGTQEKKLGGKAVNVSIDKENKVGWLEELEEEKCNLRKECSKLEGLRGRLRERIGVLRIVVEKFEKLAGQGGHLAEARQTFEEQGKSELSSLESILLKWDNEWEEKDKRVTFLDVLVDYIKHDRYTE